MKLKIFFLIVGLGVYITLFLVYLFRRKRSKEIESLIDIKYNEKAKTFFFEEKLLKSLKIRPEKAKGFLFLERLILVFLIAFILFSYRGIAIFFVGAIVTSILFDDLSKKVIYDSGISNVPNIMNFINYFVPHINSGNSANQSFLGYIEYSGNEELREFYENIDNPDYKIPPHLKQIIDIFDIARYNEEKGISDYVYILDELSKDMSQKQTYYNNYVSRVGEIKPICWSYYIGVPILILVSFQSTYSFWMGIWGWICSIVLLILFCIFKFLIYKLQKNTITTIF